jgi:hypothetical protein
MSCAERTGGLLVVPQGEHDGAPEPRRTFAGERHRGRNVEPSQAGDDGWSGSVTQRPDGATGPEIGDVDGRDHRSDDASSARDNTNSELGSVGGSGVS